MIDIDLLQIVDPLREVAISYFARVVAALVVAMLTLSGLAAPVALRIHELWSFKVGAPRRS